MDEKMRRTGREALYLMGCALHGTRPERGIESPLEELYTFCEFHSVAPVAAAALEPVWKETPPDDPEAARKFRSSLATSVRKNILMNAEREQILRFLEETGCWYMPLKGSLLQYDYPKFGIRQMSDNDILIDPSHQEAVHAFMLQRGYTAVSYQTTVENNYHKAPLYNFELHTALFGAESDPKLGAYYADVRSRLVPEEGKRYGFRFTPEDFYIYMVAHAWKHAQRSGIGIRFLADLWVWLRRHGAEMDRGRVDSALAQLGAADFERDCRLLSARMLDAPDVSVSLTPPEEALLDQFLAAGTYGTAQRKISNRLQRLQSGGKLVKLRYLLARIFPSARELSLTHPGILEQRWKVPLIWILRLVRAATTRLPDTLRELRMVEKTDRDMQGK